MFMISSALQKYCITVCVCVCVKVKVVQSCLTLCDPMGYTVQGILQAKILEWVAIPFSMGSSQPRDQTQVSHITGRFFTIWATREAQEYWSGEPIPSPVDLPIPGIEPGSPALQADSLPTELLGKLMFVYEGALLLSYITDETLRTLGKWKKGQIWRRLTNLISSNIECCWSKLVGFATCEDSQTQAFSASSSYNPCPVGWSANTEQLHFQTQLLSSNQQFHVKPLEIWYSQDGS